MIFEFYNMKNEFQKLIIKTLYGLLQDPIFQTNCEKASFKKIFDELIRKYPEFNSEGVHVIEYIDRLKTHCKFTVAAVKSIDGKYGKKYSQLKQFIHREHIFPVSECRRQLLRLMETDFTLEQVERIVEKSEIIIISREEEKIMSRNYKSKGEPDKRLSVVGATIHPDYQNNSLN